LELQKLTVHHYGETSVEDRRITLSPMNIMGMAAEVEDVTVNGRSVRNVSVLFLEGGSIGLCVNHSDLSLLESAIGTFALV
jgi:hypothetical protein